MICHIKFLLLFSLVSNNLKNYGRRHFNYLPNDMFRGTPCTLDLGG